MMGTPARRVLHQDGGGRGRRWGHDQDIGSVEQRKACLKERGTRARRTNLGNVAAPSCRCECAEQTLFFQLGEVAPRWSDRRTIAMGANVLNRDDLLLLQKAQDDDVALGRKHSYRQ